MVTDSQQTINLPWSADVINNGGCRHACTLQDCLMHTCVSTAGLHLVIALETRLSLQCNQSTTHRSVGVTGTDLFVSVQKW